MLWAMHKRFHWTGLLAALVLAAALAPLLLLTGLLPRYHGRALDLTCGRELEFEEVLGVRARSSVRASALSRSYKRYVGALPDEHHYMILWVAKLPPSWLSPHTGPAPPPRPGLLSDVVHELNQLVADSTYGEQPQDRLSFAARGAAIDRTLTILRLTEDPQLAFNYVRGLARQLNAASEQLDADDFLTAEQYLTHVVDADRDDPAS